MPKATLLSSLFSGLSQGANFAGQNYLPYKQQQKRDARTEVVEGRQDEIFNRGTEEYEHGLEQRPILEERTSDLFNRGTTQFNQGQTLFDQGQDDYRYNLNRRPVVDKFFDEQSQANIDRTNRLNTGPGGSTGAGRSDLSELKFMQEQKTNALLDQVLSTINSQGFAEEDSQGGLSNFFGFDSPQEDLRDHLKGKDARGMGVAELYDLLRSFENYNVENFPTLDSLMKEATQYAGADADQLRALRDRGNRQSQPNPERDQTFNAIDNFRQQNR